MASCIGLYRTHVVSTQATNQQQEVASLEATWFGGKQGSTSQLMGNWCHLSGGMCPPQPILPTRRGVPSQPIAPEVANSTLSSTPTRWCLSPKRGAQPVRGCSSTLRGCICTWYPLPLSLLRPPAGPSGGRGRGPYHELQGSAPFWWLVS